MRRLKKKEFIKCKRSDTLVIYGCGTSINALTSAEKKKLKEYDSVGFNWFCKSKIPTTFYIIREQASIKRRIGPGETLKDLSTIMSKKPYINSCLIVHDVREHSPHSLPYPAIVDRIFPYNRGVILKDLRGGNASDFNKDPFTAGIQHGKVTLTNVLHMAFWLDYKNIKFVGIDLYDSKYFWLGNKRRHTIKQPNAPHKVGHHTLNIISQTMAISKKQGRKIKMTTNNPRSLLTSIMNVEPII